MQIDPAEPDGQFLAVWRLTDGRRSLCVSGELDLATAPLLERALAGEIESGADLTFDIDGLRFIDAAGLEVLLRVRRYIGRRGRVLLRDPRPIVRRVLSLTGLDGAEGFDQSANEVPARPCARSPRGACPVDGPRPTARLRSCARNHNGDPPRHPIR